MPKTASRNIHRDSDPLATGTHKGANYSDDSDQLLAEDGAGLLLEDGGDLLLEGSGSGGNPATQLYDKGACFRSLGVDPSLELFCENETRGTSGTVTAATEDRVTVSGVEWYYGDTYNIYKTSTKNSFISQTWNDVSRGWGINHPRDINRWGWKNEDWDIDDKGREEVFDPYRT